MNLFKSYFIKTINEDNVAGAGGVFGDVGGGYADGDARIPTFIGSKPVTKRKKRKKRSKRKVKREQLAILRRNLKNVL